ncbi:MAG: hypothetical protein IJP93_03175 [Bacteroidales bacterium]|nr:hypothetical protein [Bacteroidales bacterium]
MEEYLLAHNWIYRGDILVLYSNPRLGWKPDGTLIIGYHEYPEKVYTPEALEAIIKKI